MLSPAFIDLCAVQVLSVAFCTSLCSRGLEHVLNPAVQHTAALRVLNLGGLLLEWPLVRLLARLPVLSWLNVTDTTLDGVVPAGCGGGAGRETAARVLQKPRGVGLRCYEYVAPVGVLPGLAPSAVPRVSLSMGVTAGAAGGGADGEGLYEGDGLFARLETLHSDRCNGVSALIRFIALRCDGRALRRVTLSGDEVHGADLLLLAQVNPNLARFACADPWLR
jgi:hypothetical protein